MYALHLKQPATLGWGHGLHEAEDCTLTLANRVAQLTVICPISHRSCGWREAKRDLFSPKGIRQLD